MPCRIGGALGLASIKLVADSKEQALKYMLDNKLEFMPSVYCSGYEIIDITEQKAPK